MPGLTGIEVLGKIRNICPETAVIILTGHATVDTAVQALRLGAFDYLTKPCKWAELESILKRVAERRDLSHKAVALETRLKQAEGTPLLVGEGSAMNSVRNLIDTIAPTDASVLILGETGTGKELVARNLHDRSRRSDGAFVPVNCGALPENLVESELFGHRKGAFTGAETSRKGLFEVANGGTLFLDEIGELNKSVQVKLLRFLESGEIRRVGENDPFRVDVRVLCATHRDLRDMIQEDLFREDLYFRLNTFEIHLPSLRERREDIPNLAAHMIKRFHRHQGPPPALTAAALEMLMEHHWSGNVRELANAMERAVILSAGRPILPEHLPNFGARKSPVGNASSSTAASQVMQSGSKTVISHSGHVPSGSNLTLRDVEMQFIQSVLEKHNGNKPAAAKELGISLKTLYNKINQLQQTGAVEE
jgi:DNA-binding NtrC family response regulator